MRASTWYSRLLLVMSGLSVCRLQMIEPVATRQPEVGILVVLTMALDVVGVGGGGPEPELRCQLTQPNQLFLVHLSFQPQSGGLPATARTQPPAAWPGELNNSGDPDPRRSIRRRARSVAC